MALLGSGKENITYYEFTRSQSITANALSNAVVFSDTGIDPNKVVSLFGTTTPDLSNNFFFSMNKNGDILINHIRSSGSQTFTNTRVVVGVQE